MLGYQGSTRRRLVGRRRECGRLLRLVTAARSGRGRALVLRGEEGIGKTALLEFMIDRAAGCRVTRTNGVEAEQDLPFAALHRLLTPYRRRLGDLPARQRQALNAAFGLRPGGDGDPVLAGRAVLTLLSEAGDRPVLCVVDDAQWLDDASARVLAHLAGQLATRPLSLVQATRTAGDAGPASLTVAPLSHGDAATLVSRDLPGALDHRVRDRILEESHGNPRTLLELPRTASVAELAFGGTDDDTVTPAAPGLPRLLLIAAADPLGDLPLLWRAAAHLGIGPDAGPAAEATGLVTLDGRVRFRHPGLRAAVYRSATLAARREAHRVLAAATDPDSDPDRRAWHRGRAATGPDEAVAAGLQRWADRAGTHGGVAAKAAFLDQAAALSLYPPARIRRALNGALAKAQAGLLPEARALVAAAEVGPLTGTDRDRITLLRARIALAENRGRPAGLLPVARRLGGHDPYLAAMEAALLAGRLATGPDAREVAQAVRAARTDGDELLDGLAILLTEGYPAAAPTLRRAVREEPATWLGAATAAALWDHDAWDAVTRRFLDAARWAGARSVLPMAVNLRAVVHLFQGDLATAEALAEQARPGVGRLGAYAMIGLCAVRGRPGRAEPLIAEFRAEMVANGEGLGVNMAQWALAVLNNGLGRYPEALAAAREAAAHPHELTLPRWALGELIEAAVRSGEPDAAADALRRLSAMTRASGTDWALGIEAGHRALLSDGDRADALYREAIDLLSRTTMRLDLTRARLLYGEWLRRSSRRVDARVHLRIAYETFTAMGAEAFADRARRELGATAETSRRRRAGSSAALTTQEAHIARLAADGLTNPEIAATLFISPRTVEWHLRRIFTKLGVGTRRQLRRIPAPG